MTSLAQVPPAVNTCTKSQFESSQRARAEELATAATVTERDFRAIAAKYPLPILRLASTRYIVARGRNHEQVIDRLVAAIQNPNVNHGDSFAIALGHIEATYRERSRWGIS